MRYVKLIICLLLLSACQLQDKPKTAISVDMYNATNDMVGTAKLTEHPDGVKLKLKIAGVTSGYHGVHIHEIANCEAPTFKSAGNHFNPKDKEHGLMNAKGAHLGDLPNVEANLQGEIDEELTVQDATLLNGNTSLTEHGGTSIIITEEADDGMTQISGDSGERIICGAIKNNEETDEEEPEDPTEEE